MGTSPASTWTPGRLMIGIPLAWRLASGTWWTLALNTRPRLVKKSAQSCVFATRRCSTASSSRRTCRSSHLDVGRVANRLDDRVEVVEGDLEALEDVRPRPRLLEVVLGPPPDGLPAVVDVVLEDGLQGQRLGLAVDEGEHVEVEGQLHRRVLEEVVQDRVRVDIVCDLY